MSSIENTGVVALGARVHIFLKPSNRERFMKLFAEVLGCTILEREFPGKDYPILLALEYAGP